MTVTISKPKVNIRDELNALRLNSIPAFKGLRIDAQSASPPVSMRINGDEYFKISPTGEIGIGKYANYNPNVVLQINGMQMNSRVYSSDTAPFYHATVKSRGTFGAVTSVNNNDGIFAYQAYAYDGSMERAAAVIAAHVDGVPANSTIPGRLTFYTTPAGTSQLPVERMRIGSDGGVSIGTTAAAGTNALRVVNTLLTTDRLEINGLGTGNRYAYIDLIGDDTYTDYGARLIRDNNGANAATLLIARGTGDLIIKTVEAGAISLATSDVERMRVSSTGIVDVTSDKIRLNSTNNDSSFEFFNSGVRKSYIRDFGSGLNIVEEASQPILFYTNGVERMRIDSAGNVGIGTTPSADSPLHIFSNAGGIKRVILHNAATTANTAARYDLATGTPNAYSILGQTEDGAGNVILQLATGVGVNQGIRLAPSVGNVTVNTVAGLGYGTGAGGTVTQATSKSTAVTLNKPTGQITMNNAALAAGAMVTFVLNNSLIGGADQILLTFSSGFGAGNYNAWVSYMGTGSCGITLKNISGGSLSEAGVINFAIIKGATA